MPVITIDIKRVIDLRKSRYDKVRIWSEVREWTNVIRIHLKKEIHTENYFQYDFLNICLNS